MYWQNATFVTMILVEMEHPADPFQIATMSAYVHRGTTARTATQLLMHATEILVQMELHAKFLKLDDLRKLAIQQTVKHC